MKIHTAIYLIIFVAFLLLVSFKKPVHSEPLVVSHENCIGSECVQFKLENTPPISTTTHETLKNLHYYISQISSEYDELISLFPTDRYFLILQNEYASHKLLLDSFFVKYQIARAQITIEKKENYSTKFQKCTHLLRLESAFLDYLNTQSNAPADLKRLITIFKSDISYHDFVFLNNCAIENRPSPTLTLSELAPK